MEVGHVGHVFVSYDETKIIRFDVPLKLILFFQTKKILYSRQNPMTSQKVLTRVKRRQLLIGLHLQLLIILGL